MDLGPHAAFIWASYVIVAVIVGALVGWTIFDGRRQANALADAERRGLKRRSADSGNAGRSRS
jgi:heme exporter protein D